MKLIDKDALVAEIRKRLLPVNRDKHYDEWEEGQDSERIAILNIIDRFEVKEVDFEKELDRIWFDNGLGNYFDNDAIKFARIRTLCKHFFELGMTASNKAQKGE